MATLELQSVEKVFDDGTCAVDGVTTRVADGEFVAVLGPSGCGKTTLLRLIAGLDRLTGGEISIDGERIDGDTPQQRDVAMAFQHYALYPHLTVAQNIGFSLRCAGLHRREIAMRVAALAGRLGLADVLDRRPAQLSGGQQQRVAMARAIVRDPRLFLMDEPISNLDAKLRAEARATICSTHRRLGSTTVYVTHDQVEAMSMSDRVLVMRRGRIVQRGAPLDVYRRPVDLFVASFLGSPPLRTMLADVVPAPDGDVELRLGSHRQTVRAGSLRGADRVPAGGRVVVGVRPEAVRLDPDGPLELSVESVEQRGREWQIDLVVDAPAVRVGEDGVGFTVSDHPWSTLTALEVFDRPPGLWAPLRVAIDPAGVHLFDADDGSALDRG